VVKTRGRDVPLQLVDRRRSECVILFFLFTVFFYLLPGRSHMTSLKTERAVRHDAVILTKMLVGASPFNTPGPYAVPPGPYVPPQPAAPAPPVLAQLLRLPENESLSRPFARYPVRGGRVERASAAAN
jgi:hypothetical protein